MIKNERGFREEAEDGKSWSLLNCEKFVKCDDLSKFEECVGFREVEGEAWLETRVGE